MGFFLMGSGRAVHLDRCLGIAVRLGTPLGHIQSLVSGLYSALWFVGNSQIYRDLVLSVLSGYALALARGTFDRTSRSEN